MPHLLGGLQNIENQEEECSDIEKREGPGGSKSQRPIERGSGNRKNRKERQRLSHRPEKVTELQPGAISQWMRTDHRLIE
jgi:hypothetical protein